MFENIDNRTKLLGDDLKNELRKGSKVRIASSCFSMYAIKELKEELSQIDELKFLFTSPTFTKYTIAFNDGYGIKHIYFVAETKGNMSTLSLDKIEESKTNCVRKLFNDLKLANNVRYEVVDTYQHLLDIMESIN